MKMTLLDQIVWVKWGMNIITLNTWGTYGPWENRWNYFLDALAPLEPDILFLQEVVDESLPQKILKRFSYPYLSVSYQAGLAILSKIPMSLYKNHRYTVVSRLESHDRRALAVKIKIRQEQWILANTHLSWKVEDGETRKKQAQQLLEIATEAKLPVLLAGDFNDVPESEPVQKIKAAGFRDAFEICGSGPGLTWDNSNPFIQSHETKFPDRRIDYLFLSGTLASAHPTLSCRVVFNQKNAEGIYPSDHYGVMAELKT